MKTPLLAGPWALALALAATGVAAQYKVVGPDGKVTYTDRVPSPTDGRAVALNRDGTVANEAALPYALRQVATRFPVTLYTASECGQPCDLGRNLLTRRGVPFNERVATSAEEREAWSRIVGGTEAPALTVGQQSLRGFNQGSWDETLDLAGYPRTSQLPASYQAPKPTPLIAPKPQEPRAAAAPRPAPADRDATNPTGIRF